MATQKQSRTRDAIALLKADHRLVEGLFKDFEKASGAARKAKIAKTICAELSVHATVEEELFYPAVEPSVDDEISTEAYVEHDGAKVLIAEILASKPDDHFYEAKVTVLSEAIKHHVKEEEQSGGLFAQARKSDVDMVDLGAQISMRKQELKKLIAREGIPTPETRTMTGAKLRRGTPA